MMHKKLELPGIDRIRNRFLEMLQQRQFAIAENALAAWESKDVETINASLSEARTILHQIAGTAGSLGFEELGTEARSCEMAIDGHLNSPEAAVAECPSGLVFSMDDFLKTSQALLEQHSDLTDA